MAFSVELKAAQEQYPQFKFIKRLTPSVQKAAFHVQDVNGDDLCLKIIAPGYTMERLEREVLALQRIVHPNVARLREYLYRSRDGSPQHYILEDYIDGSDFSDLMGSGAPMEVELAADIFGKLCDGLQELANLNIVHRDLKPSNIRIRKDYSPVIIDFGLARHLDLPDITATESGAAIGTPLYFAPEQCCGTKDDIDTRTDLFAIGVLMYQALTTSHPFARPQISVNELMDNICNSNAHLTDSAFQSLPNNWRVLLTRLLAKSRTDRPAFPSLVHKVIDKIRVKS